jgi:topoisomerase-4 subunit A
LRLFDDVDATKVIIRNTKLYVNREEGFIGTSLRKDEYVTDCSDIDDIIVFTREGHMMITKVGTKTFIGKHIIHVAVFKKKDTRTIYNVIYKDGKTKASYIKRFAVTSITRDKVYPITQGNKGSILSYFSANPNGEAEIVTIMLRQAGSIKKLKWELDFADLLVKGRGVKGNLVTKYTIKRIELKTKGISTLKPRKIWFDETVQRLNLDGRGDLLGEFKGEDRLLIINQSGVVKTVIPELTLHFDEDMIVLEKWLPSKPISAIYFDGEKERYNVKRFLIENESKVEQFISDHPHSELTIIATDFRPIAEIIFAKERGKPQRPNETLNFEAFIAIKGIKAQGNLLTSLKLKQVNLLDPLPYESPEELKTEDIEVIDEERITDKSELSRPNDDKESPDNDDSGSQGTLF